MDINQVADLLEQSTIPQKNNNINNIEGSDEEIEEIEKNGQDTAKNEETNSQTDEMVNENAFDFEQTDGEKDTEQKTKDSTSWLYSFSDSGDTKKIWNPESCRLLVQNP